MNKHFILQILRVQAIPKPPHAQAAQSRSLRRLPSPKCRILLLVPRAPMQLALGFSGFRVYRDMYIYIFIYPSLSLYIYIHTYIRTYIYRERDRVWGEFRV